MLYETFTNFVALESLFADDTICNRCLILLHLESAKSLHFSPECWERLKCQAFCAEYCALFSQILSIEIKVENEPKTIFNHFLNKLHACFY